MVDTTPTELCIPNIPPVTKLNLKEIPKLNIKQDKDGQFKDSDMVLLPIGDLLKLQ
jgi:hypothetical protein